MRFLDDKDTMFIKACEREPDLLDRNDTRRLLEIMRCLRLVAAGEVRKHTQHRNTSLLAGLLIVSICAAAPFMAKNCADADVAETKIKSGKICAQVYPDIMKAAGKLREVCK